MQGDASPAWIAAGDFAHHSAIDLNTEGSLLAGDDTVVPLVDRSARIANIDDFVVGAGIAAGEDAAGDWLMQLDLNRRRPDAIHIARIQQNAAVAMGILRVLPLHAQAEVLVGLPRPQIPQGLSPANEHGLVLFNLHAPGRIQLVLLLTCHEDP